MAILRDEFTEVTDSVIKEFEEGAHGLALDILQKYQYRYPFKSSIRELVSNALDSHKEREVAREILFGRLDVKDVYVDIEGVLYKDSKFDPSYYDFNYLSDDNKIKVRYIEGPIRDKIRIEDNGVGLRERDRLPGYMRIGYSSKRLNKLAIGRYGIGAKAPLSTGVPFFTFYSRYNGYEYAFNVYHANIENIVPQKELINNLFVVNEEFHVTNNGKSVTCYRRRLPKGTLNGMTVEFEVKKHQKSQVVEAVKSQLMYFPNVEFSITDINGNSIWHPTAAEILMQNEKFIVSSQNYYKQPHIVIAGMNYGLIDFDELEMEKKLGALGVIVEQEEVDLLPSRESLVWTDRTRDVVVKALDDVTILAQSIVSEEMQEPDLLTWMQKASVFNAASADTDNLAIKALNALKHLVDSDKINPTFPIGGMKVPLKYISGAFSYVRTSLVGSVLDRNAGKLESEDLILWDEDASAVKSKDLYLTSTQQKKSYIRIIPNYKALLTDPKLDDKGYKPLYYTRSGEIQQVLEKSNKLMPSGEVRDAILNHIYNYLRTKFQSYADVVVPEDFGKTTELEDIKVVDKEEQKLEKIKLSLANKQLLKQSREELLKVGQAISGISGYERVTVPTELLKNLDTSEIYYGNSIDKRAIELADMICSTGRRTYAQALYEKKQEIIDAGGTVVTSSHFSINGVIDGWAETLLAVARDGRRGLFMFASEPPYVGTLQIAANNNKHMKGYYHINDFFYRATKDKITMASALINWNTARLIYQELSAYWEIDDKLLFSLPNLQARLSTLRRFVTSFYTDDEELLQKKHVTELVTLLDRMSTLQKFLSNNEDADPQMIAGMIQEVGGDGQRAIDCMHLELFEEALEIKQVLQQLQILRWIEIPYNQEKEVSQDVEDFINIKNVQDVALIDLRSYLEW